MIPSSSRRSSQSRAGPGGWPRFARASFVLAQAGLLNGRRATTHWHDVRLFARAFPDITVEPDAIFVRDGDVFTSAGVSSGIDLALALVEMDHGIELVRAVARWLVVYLKRAGGQSQFSVLVEAAPPAAVSAAQGHRRNLGHSRGKSQRE